VTTPAIGHGAGRYNVLVSDSNGESGAGSNDGFWFDANVIVNAGKPVANLKLTAATRVVVDGYGFGAGLNGPTDFVAVSVCNSDAALPDPTSQYPPGPASACSAIDPQSISTKDDFVQDLTLTPGEQQSGVSLSECPQTFAQAQEGVACIIGIADLTTGSTFYAPVYFATPPLTSTDTWVSGTTSSALYTINLIDAATHTLSNDPPVVTTAGQPNNGGFATSGLLCEPGTGPLDNNTCVPEGTGTPGQPGFVPATCQANSVGYLTIGSLSSTGTTGTAVFAHDPGFVDGSQFSIFGAANSAYDGAWTVASDSSGTVTFGVSGALGSDTGGALGEAGPWSGESLCSYGVGVGEPVEVLFTAYTPPTTESGDNPPFPPSTVVPFDCDADGCSVNAEGSATATDPGGFDNTLATMSGTTPTAIDWGPGKYTFEAIGSSSGQTAKGAVTLLPGPTS